MISGIALYKTYEERENKYGFIISGLGEKRSIFRNFLSRFDLKIHFKTDSEAYGRMFGLYQARFKKISACGEDGGTIPHAAPEAPRFMNNCQNAEEIGPIFLV
jgi:hypothetical protein